ncbi:hypothetical protein [Modestobacter sp. Leaf380]|uniref:hypothetical protein n=1 Tax=Modestobacter sp. Leaf380 TaxID=1736356 RepID=UPI0006FEA5B1|nr:hypothetical protein [Modestobacter sp. Leaf380]KQS64355.1 hypothetical protein ASG41_17145 [Modestobacter sp. Leaf380]
MRQALRGLDSRNAEVVGQHLVAAGGLVDEDPETALAHARAARDRASRIAAVREAVGVAAYHAGDYAEAASELRAYRRMSGDQGYRAVLADCERALGKPEVALRLVSEALAARPEPEEIVELQLVESGARQDLDELPAAALVLESALGGRPDPESLQAGDLGRLRLATAYADLLVVRGDAELADQWFSAIMAADPEDETGVSERFSGIEFDEDDDDLEDGDDLQDDLDDDLDDDQADDEVGDEPTAVPEAVDSSDAGDTGDSDLDTSVDTAGGAMVEPQAASGSEAVAEAAADGAGDSSEETDDDEDLVDGEDVGPGYDPDEDDVEAEVAELLGEIPAPGFSDEQAPSTTSVPRSGAAGHTGLFQAAEIAEDTHGDDDGDEQVPTRS